MNKINKMKIKLKTKFATSLILIAIALLLLVSTAGLIYTRNVLQAYISLGIIASVFTAALIIAFFLANRVVSPVEQIKKALLEMGKGNLAYRVEVETGDEIEDLAKGLNQMAERLGKALADLEEAKTALEIKVEARTKELKELTDQQEEVIRQRTKEIKERMEELERFHRLAVGRELKMVELKEEIKKLKNAGASRS